MFPGLSSIWWRFPRFSKIVRFKVSYGMQDQGFRAFRLKVPGTAGTGFWAFFWGQA